MSVLKLWNPTTNTWEVVQGLQGEKGSTGAKGDKGEKGDKGDSGVPFSASGHLVFPNGAEIWVG